MQNNYVNNIQEIIVANQTQKSKIQFLQNERHKRQHFLKDLQQSLQLNKQTIQTLLQTTSNSDPLTALTELNQKLYLNIGRSYEDYQDINARWLMQRQMRLEEKNIYQDRMSEFQNKISELRKYLHDKEDSFSSVVARLRRYEEINQSPLDEKLGAYKAEMSQNLTSQFISKIVQQKNEYKHKYESIKDQQTAISTLTDYVTKEYPKDEHLIGIITGSIKKQPSPVTVVKKEEVRKGAVQPNKQLIRLLKKQKLSNEILQQALNEAIQKNQELINYKNKLSQAYKRTQAKLSLLRSQNVLLSLRISEYDSHYHRKITHNRQYYEQGQSPNLLHKITSNKIRKYGQILLQNKELHSEMKNSFIQKMKEDVQKWSQFLQDSIFIKKQHQQSKILTKSCSVPQLIIDYELEQDEEMEIMEIEEY